MQLHAFTVHVIYVKYYLTHLQEKKCRAYIVVGVWSLKVVVLHPEPFVKHKVPLTVECTRVLCGRNPPIRFQNISQGINPDAPNSHSIEFNINSHEFLVMYQEILFVNQDVCFLNQEERRQFLIISVSERDWKREHKLEFKMASNRFYIPNVNELFEGLISLLQQCGDCVNENTDGGHGEFLQGV